MSHASWEWRCIIGVGMWMPSFSLNLFYILRACEHTLYLKRQLRSGGKLIGCLKWYLEVNAFGTT